MRAVCAFLCIVLPFAAAAVASDASSKKVTHDIKLDQVGYPIDAPKIALVASPRVAKTFVVRRTTDDVKVFGGILSAPAADPMTGDRVQQADFSKLVKPGSYYLEVPGVGRSWRFAIASDVYARTYYLAMRAFYGQRCGMAVDLGPDFPGYSHPACHLNAAFHESSGKQGNVNVIGGWHDAGDYGRYTVNSGITNGTLLWAWEMFGSKLKDRGLRIPESGNGTPDILNETRWNVEWMLRMQDVDGGAWHKETSEHFSAFIAPDQDKLRNEIIGTGAAPFKSTCATADLAAVAAIAARVYAPYDKAFAERSLVAARKGWEWTERNPNVVFKNPPGVTTGEYGDNECKDERLWAAAELWRTTGESVYQQFFLANYQPYLPMLESAIPDSWGQLAPMAMWTYVLGNRTDRDAKAVADITNATVNAAGNIVKRTNADPYHVSLREMDYSWGSNGLAAQYGMQLLIANALAPNPEFTRVALDNLHYLLGRNTFSLSWVTQVGENPFRHPHHRPSVASKLSEPWPGLLSGGPNSHRQDAVLKELPELPPAKIYKDNKESYASNEIAINWQAPLVFLLAGELQSGAVEGASQPNLPGTSE